MQRSRYRPRRHGRWIRRRSRRTPSTSTQPLGSQTPKKALFLIGASRGLGFALAEEYLRRGWHVVATERDKSTSKPHGLLQAAAGRLDIETVDIVHPHQVAALRGRLASRNFDMLFVNSGVTNDDRETIADVGANRLGRTSRASEHRGKHTEPCQYHGRAGREGGSSVSGLSRPEGSPVSAQSAGTFDVRGHADTLDTSGNPSSSHPVTPPDMIFTGKPSRASRKAPREAPLQCGPAQ
jgi:short subunit dehydrogenase